jgi:Holliday junction DNA helicase RuvB
VGTGASPPEAAGLALDRQDIDHFWGLDPLDRRMLTLMIQNYAGGPVGLDTLAAAWVRNR